MGEGGAAGSLAEGRRCATVCVSRSLRVIDSLTTECRRPQSIAAGLPTPRSAGSLLAVVVKHRPKIQWRGWGDDEQCLFDPHCQPALAHAGPAPAPSIQSSVLQSYLCEGTSIVTFLEDHAGSYNIYPSVYNLTTNTSIRGLRVHPDASHPSLAPQHLPSAPPSIWLAPPPHTPAQQASSKNTSRKTYSIPLCSARRPAKAATTRGSSLNRATCTPNAAGISDSTTDAKQVRSAQRADFNRAPLPHAAPEPQPSRPRMRQPPLSGRQIPPPPTPLLHDRPPPRPVAPPAGWG